LEVTLEQQILAELQKVSQGQDNLKGQVRDLRMSLMGKGDEGETEHGRLPIAESEIKAIDKRLEVLEEAHVRYGVYGKFITGGSAAAASVIGIAVEKLFHSMFGK
jgi:hypothetical protein